MADSASPTLWVLADDRIGNVNQCLGVAEKLGYPTTIKKIAYTRLASLPNCLRGASLLGIDPSKSDPLDAPYPDIVIAAGRKTAPVARYIKKHHSTCLTVQIMWPGNPLDGLDIIAAPKHDNVAPLSPHSKTTLLTTIGAPHRVTQTRLSAEFACWQERIAPFPAPRIAVLIGGTTKDHTITDSHITQLGLQLSAIVTAQGGSLLVSTSRRTDAPIVAALKAAITVPCCFYEWTPNGENPYFGFLAGSDVVVVTGDSMSMCSEACATGKPVYIFSPDSITSRKHKRLHEQLYSLGFAKPFNGELAPAWHSTPLDVAGEIAEAIRRKI